jgi:uncharacterized protein (TIGR02996 family)
MRLERVFTDGAKKTTLLLSIEKGQLETVLAADGKERKKTERVASWSYKDYAKQFQKLLKDGKTTTPLKDPPKVAADLAKAADLDLSDALDAFLPAERKAIVAQALAQAEKARKIICNTHYEHVRADVFAKCPTPELLRHFLAGMLDGRLEWKSANQAYATAISNAARDENNRAWIAEEVEKVLPSAEPELKKWLQARTAKLRSQAKVKKALAGTAAKPAATEEKLLAMIGESPDDDAPRQVWADWLLEHGSKWGDFVLAQCELARIEKGKGSRDPKWREVYDRAQKLQTPNVAKFMAPIKPYVSDYHFERGLLSRVTASAEKLLAAGAAEAVILRAPRAHLKLQGLKPDHAAGLATLPRGRLAAIEVAGKIAPEALRALLRSPLLDGVREMTIWNTNAKGAAELTALPASVRDLSLWHAADPDGAIAAILQSSAAKTLERLSLPGKGKPSAEGEKLLRKFPKLKRAEDE